jgi:predicted SnoaL-like aldol condensation-catalyzing enzyme
MPRMNTNKAVALRWFEEVWNDACADSIPELTDPNIVGHLEGNQTFHGHDGMRELQRQMFEALPGVKAKVLRAVGEDDVVSVHWHMSVPKSQKIPAPVEFTGMTLLRFANDKIVEGWDCWNQGGLKAQLAALQG